MKTRDVCNGALERCKLIGAQRGAGFAKLGGAHPQIGERRSAELLCVATHRRVAFGSHRGNNRRGLVEYLFAARGRGTCQHRAPRLW